MIYKSKIKVFGLPLICISLTEPAVGFIAIGQFAYGFFTISQFGVGLIFGIGQFMGGLFSIGQFSLGPVMSIGQFSLGWYSIGMISAGFEGLHLIGYHYIKNNFLNFLVADWASFIYFLIFLLIVAVIIFVINLIFNLTYSSLKNAVGKIFNEMKHGMNESMNTDSYKKPADKKIKKNINYSFFVKVGFLLLSIIFVFGFFKSLKVDKAFDLPRYKRIYEIGISCNAEVLEVKNLNITINKRPIIILKLKIYPEINTELLPYEVNISVLINKNIIPKKGDKLLIKYDEKNPKEVIWVNSY